jgi:outer membrane lipoprotein SlyB
MHIQLRHQCIRSVLILSAVFGGVLNSGPAMAQPATKALAQVAPKVLAICDGCAMVTQVVQEKRKGKGGAVGVVGGAVAGGVLGNQVGGGTGNTVATVGGAVAGGVIGNEIQKRMNKRKVWVTTVTLKDGSTKSFEQADQPTWVTGNVVRVVGTTLAKQ